MSSNSEAAEKLIADVLDGEHSLDDGSFAREQVFMLAGIGYALLDVADAIREQTEALHLGGIRDDLGEIAHAAGKARRG